MSFILDALKKSESERQQQTGAGFSDVPSSSSETQSFKWLWILGLLLLVNIVILIGILTRNDKAPDIAAPVEEMPLQLSQSDEQSFEDRVAEARQSQPPPVAEVADEPQTQAAAPRTNAPASRARVLTIDEVRLNGSLQMTDLHLDIHVFSENPTERFVFINMTKYRERSQLDEGPVVVEITPEGVILEHQGTSFLLPRE